MPGKGQAEIALILGLLAIALVVGIYSYSALTPPTVRQSALTQEQKSVAVFAEDMIRDATLDTVSTMYRNGGYLDVSESGLGFLESDSFGKVAYWQMCENAEFPHVESELERGLREYINEYLSDSVSMSGKPALFSKAAMQVEADVQEDRVEVSVNLPTVFEGVAIEQPYEVTVSTKLGRVTDFSRNFAIMQADLRVLDSHLIKSLQQSSEYSSCWIPYGMGSAWGTHSLSWKDLKDCMESHIKYSLSNTQIGREIPVTEDGKIASFHYRGWSGTAMEFFFVPAINVYDPLTGSVTGSDRYEDLRISFFFGDDDGLNKSDFSAPDHLEIKQNEGAFMRFLRAANLKAAEYSQVYSVKYPVVVNVWDSSARKSLRFATYVYIEENDIGTGCTTPPAISQVQQSEESGTYGDRCLSGATEDAMVTVKYRDTGLPVENARVGYGGCDLGITNELGEVWGRIWQAPFSALTVSVDGNVYAECYNYEEMKGILMDGRQLQVQVHEGPGDKGSEHLQHRDAGPAGKRRNRNGGALKRGRHMRHGRELHNEHRRQRGRRSRALRFPASNRRVRGKRLAAGKREPHGIREHHFLHAVGKRDLRLCSKPAGIRLGGKRHRTGDGEPAEPLRELRAQSRLGYGVQRR
jgi:hypothetical protein